MLVGRWPEVAREVTRTGEDRSVFTVSSWSPATRGLVDIRTACDSAGYLIWSRGQVYAVDATVQ